MAESVLASTGKFLPLWLTRWRELRERHPYRAALALGCCLGLLGTVCTLTVNQIIMSALPPELWGKSAAAHLAQMGPVWMVVMAVAYAPLIETFMAQTLPIEIARRVGAGPLLCVLLSAFLFGLGHYVNGGLAHGTITFVGGLVFAIAYVALRPRGSGSGFVAAATAHAVQNGVVILYFVSRPA